MNDVIEKNQTGRTKNSVRNIITGFILKIVCIVLPFIIRTVIIKKLGMEYLGLNSLFSSILQVLSLSELGFSVTISFCLYKPLENKESEVVKALLNYLKKAYFIIGIIILFIGLALMPVLPYLINGSYPSDINLYLLYSIYLVNTVISYIFFAYRSVLFNASQRSDIENKITLFVSIIMYSVQVLFLFLFQNYYIYIIVLPISTFIINLLKFVVSKKKYPDYFPQGKISHDERKKINSNIKALVGHKLSSTIVNSTDSIFISAILGLNMLAIFQNYFYIVSSLLSVVNIVYSSITASIGNSIAFEDKAKNKILFYRLNFLNVLMIGWMSICMICLYQHFIELWVGKENLLPFGSVCLFVFYFYSWKFKEILSVFKDAAGMWRLDFWKPYIISVLNIILDSILIYFLGVNGALIATIVSVSFISLPWETHVFFKNYFEESPKTFYVKLLLLSTLVLFAGLITYITCYFLPSVGILWFIIKILICIFVPTLIFLICTFKSDEFKWILSKLKNIW